MAKKHWSVLFGLSVAVGVVGSLLFKKEKEKNDAATAHLTSLYTGTWWFVDKKKNVQHTLEINDDLEMTLDGRMFNQKLIELTAEKLVLQDEYGYQLVFSLDPQRLIHFYDEANDQTYHLEARTS